MQPSEPVDLRNPPHPPLQVRVVKQQPAEVVACMLGRLFSGADSADTLRQLCVGVSAHQKLDLLASLVRLLGYESLAVFGDCFDEVGWRGGGVGVVVLCSWMMMACRYLIISLTLLSLVSHPGACPMDHLH